MYRLTVCEAMNLFDRSANRGLSRGGQIILSGMETKKRFPSMSMLSKRNLILGFRQESRRYWVGNTGKCPFDLPTTKY